MTNNLNAGSREIKLHELMKQKQVMQFNKKH